MTILQVLLVCVLTTTSFHAASTLSKDINTDRSALLSLKAQLVIIPNDDSLNWSADSGPVCSWIGVSCSARHHRVSALNLSSMDIGGVLPPHLGNLSFLISIDLSLNSFRGSIPLELFALRRLEYANLKDNRFSGSIPTNLFSAPSLNFVSLSNNFLTGSIPTSIAIANTSSLQNIRVDGNNLTGELPAEIFHRLPHLNIFSASLNMLTGPIPSSISRCRLLEGLSLSFNEFRGSIPPEIGNLTMLQKLFLRENKLTGAIPLEMSDLINLEILNLMSNALTGEIPSFLANSTNLIQLGLSKNQLSGPIPSDIFRAPSLTVVSLESNFLTGSIPTDISNTSSLLVIGLDTNNLTGELPAGIFRHLPNLIFFGASLNMLSGPIPSSLSWCRLLETLQLFGNEFGGSIPAEIGNLTMLTKLSLGTNKLTGAIPLELGNLVNLQSLQLENNPLTSEISSSLGNLTKLLVLALADCRLTGHVPKEVGKLQSLKTLDVSRNSLGGSIPGCLFNITSLERLGIPDNNFTGSLPPSLQVNLPNLMDLVMYNNTLTGTLPASILNSSKFRMIDISYNHFSGFVHEEFGKMSQLQFLGLYSNNFTASDPPHSFFCSLANCTSLRYLALSDNPLNTILPSCIANLSSTLQYIEMDRCQFRGTIPPEIGGLKNLTFLALRDNGLSGTLPPTVGRMESLQGFHVRRNKLQGPIPHEICQLNIISDLFLDENKLNGSIPACLGNAISLRKVSFSGNRLSMEIPSSFWDLRDIFYLDLSRNFFNGSLSEEIGNLRALQVLNLSHNRLNGAIPPNVAELANVQVLSLEYNQLNGSIPHSFGDLKSLTSLDLSNNNLSGAIPSSLEKLSYLTFFNVSFNRLEGQIPDGGPFKNFSAESFISNGDNLCGATRFQVPTCKHIVSPSKKKKRSTMNLLKYILPITISSMVFGLLILALVLMRQRKKNEVGVPSNTSELSVGPWRRLSYIDLVKATERFHESNLLGAGSFGSVYKGELQDGTHIAVKVFNQDAEDAFKSFDVECEVLKNIRHVNLVKVITSCCSPDFKCLVLEYMSNGTLDKWLYSDNHYLDILQRLNIMIDVAAALEYLHHHHFQPIVHCDLKPSNVLLDKDMVANVADFGISKLLTGGDSITRTLSLATIGYTAPEYGLEGVVSTAGDVYSYGILLIETFTARRPTDERFAAETSLKQWVARSLPHNAHEVSDSRLLNIEDQHFEKKKACISSIMEVALGCCAEKREERISIKDVIAALEKIKVTLVRDPRFIS